MAHCSYCLSNNGSNVECHYEQEMSECKTDEERKDLAERYIKKNHNYIFEDFLYSNIQSASLADLKKFRNQKDIKFIELLIKFAEQEDMIACYNLEYLGLYEEELIDFIDYKIEKSNDCIISCVDHHEFDLANREGFFMRQHYCDDFGSVEDIKEFVDANVEFAKEQIFQDSRYGSGTSNIARYLYDSSKIQPLYYFDEDLYKHLSIDYLTNEVKQWKLEQQNEE